MNYFEMVNEAVDYIENNLGQRISIQDLAVRYHISKFYFTRIFKALTNQNVKEYIDGRRMTEAAGKLAITRSRVIDIALDYGFESHEAFTRKFKTAFGITPVQFRKVAPELKLLQPARVAERQFKNLHREMIVDFRIENPGSIELVGKSVRFNPDTVEGIQKVTAFFNRFVPDYIAGKGIESMIHVTSDGALPGENIDYFAGFELKTGKIPKGLRRTTLASSDYAVFQYKNSMEGIHRIVASDAWKAIALSRLTLNPIGIYFFEMYERGYQQTKQFLLYVPIKNIHD